MASGAAADRSPASKTVGSMSPKPDNKASGQPSAEPQAGSDGQPSAEPPNEFKVDKTADEFKVEVGQTWLVFVPDAEGIGEKKVIESETGFDEEVLSELELFASTIDKVNDDGTYDITPNIDPDCKETGVARRRLFCIWKDEPQTLEPDTEDPKTDEPK